MSRRRIRISIVMAILLALLAGGTNPAPANAGATRFKITERYAFRLMNCLRTGGRITKAGKCRGFGTGRFSAKRAPLKRSRRISDNVSWPWARRTAIANICAHSLARSTVDSRFRAAGITGAKNGESIGCASSWKPRKMVITVLRWWQGEKRYRGWHWRQLKDRRFRSVGVGVVKLGNGRTRLVMNFYGKAIR